MWTILTITRRRKVIVILTAALICAAVIGVWNQPALLRIGTLVSLLTETAPNKLPVPVEEVASKDLADTWGAPRSGDRRHEGIDIFAPLGRPVISTTNGVVFKVGEDNLGGHVVRVLGPGWQWHYYAHLDRFADIAPGTVVKQGTVLGYVGNTGNAQGTPYHLHYGVYPFLGAAQNPYPLLATEQVNTTTKKATTTKVRKVRTSAKHSNTTTKKTTAKQVNKVRTAAKHSKDQVVARRVKKSRDY